MKVAVAGASGVIGRAVGSRLLLAGADVVLVTRDRARVRDLADRGARVRQGSLIDGTFVLEATRGADALFWLTPPIQRSDGILAVPARLPEVVARAVRRNRISRVVNLSSFGAHLEAGTGPIAELGLVERRLDEVATHVTHFRPGYLFENYLWQAESLGHAGRIHLPVSGSVRMPMVAARDVASAAATRLLDPYWTGRSVIGLHGPEDLSFGEAAAVIGEALERPVRHVPVTPERAFRALLERGLSPGYARLVVELYLALEVGHLVPAEVRRPETTTPTSLWRFAREILRPLVEAIPVRADTAVSHQLSAVS